jgi:hypothetical protein
MVLITFASNILSTSRDKVNLFGVGLLDRDLSLCYLGALLTVMPIGPPTPFVIVLVGFPPAG